MNITKVQLSGLDFAVIDEGPRDAAAVLLLHGFPDRGSMWHNQIAALTNAGYRVIAPDLRGFGDSDAPEGAENYNLLSLMSDVTGILDALGIDQAHVVGHDWGAALAWITATLTADRVLSLTAVSVGHPSAFASAGWEQKQLSWYMLAFQHVGLAEAMVMHDDFAFFEQWGEGGQKEQWAADLSRPGRMTSGLNWYRANVPPESLLATTRMELPPVALRTMGVWSDGDGALTEAQMKNSADHVTGSFRYERVQGISHWVPTAAPDQLNALLLDFLAG
ncbi:MAG TPA: alpha/beta fold hydrolase [Acidimicrobiales bacterium]|nr:alpha/beta fold hydrolase [Acidimicrobiales bacterium]